MKMTWTLYGRKKLCMCNPIFCHRVQVIFIIRISYNGITHTEFLSNIRSRSNIDIRTLLVPPGAPGSGTIEFDTRLILKLE